MLWVMGRRVIMLVATLVVGSMLIFGVQQLVPGGAAAAVAGPDADAATIEQIQHELGLDRPVYVQYGSWLWSALHGDLGRSLVGRQEVGTQLAERLPLTIELTLITLIVSIIVGCSLGMIAALRRHARIGRTITTLSGIGIALPQFWLAMILVLIFALYLRLFPATGFVPPTNPGGNLWSLVLPVCALAASASAILVRQVRSAVIDVLNAPYIRTARALGIPKWEIYAVYLMKNAMLPLLTILGLIAAGMLGAQVAAEMVFVLPGLGSMLAPAITSKDYPIVQGVTLVYLMTVAVINIIVDIVHAWLDPRIRRG